MHVADLLTVGGVAVVVTILVQVVKWALGQNYADAWARFGPLLALVAGVLIGGAAALYLGADPAEGLLTGFLGGAASMGIYDLTKTGIAAVAP